MTNEEPPPGERERTPAERAGATPLDPKLFREHAAQAAARAASQPQSLLNEQALEEQERSKGEDLVVVRRNKRPNHIAQRKSRHGFKPWLIAAGCCVVLSLLLAAAGYFLQSDTEVSAASESPLVLASSLFSARRVAEVVVRPVAARNLQTVLQPILADAPENTCLQVRESNNAVFSFQASQPLVPASNLKLLVGAAALDLLDQNARLTTKFSTDGKPTDGSTIQGNLYMLGGGDPVLSTASFAARPDRAGQVFTDLDKVADQIYDTGVRTITGSVVGDASRHDDLRTVSSWPDRYTTQGQVAPLSALLVNDGVDGSGAIVKDPTLHAAAVLTELLKSRGIEVQSEPKVGVAPENATQLLQVESPTVSELVTEALRFSDNTTTEILVKEIGLARGGTGSTAAGVAALSQWAAASTLPAEGLNIVDGSGLSPDNRVTCAFLSALLAEGGSESAIATSLAVPGQAGTLDDRFLSEPLRSSLRAKTGTLLQVTGLSGWLATTAQRNLAFSLLINTGSRNVNASDLTTQRDVLQALLTYPDAPDLDALIPLAPKPPER